MAEIEKEMNRQKTEYRSALRSRKLIREAYVVLMQSNPINKISVSDIVREADLNRGTFYAHYSSPMDVLMEIVDEIVGDVQGFLKEFDFTNFLRDPLPLLLRVERLLIENYEFYRRINLHTLSIGFTDQIKKILITHISSDKTVPEKISSNPQFRIALELFAGGLISVYLGYVQGSFKVKPRQITETLAMLIRESACSLFK